MATREALPFALRINAFQQDCQLCKLSQRYMLYWNVHAPPHPTKGIVAGDFQRLRGTDREQAHWMMQVHQLFGGSNFKDCLFTRRALHTHVFCPCLIQNALHDGQPAGFYFVFATRECGPRHSKPCRAIRTTTIPGVISAVRSLKQPEVRKRKRSSKKRR